jgi:hypothetical protein
MKTFLQTLFLSTLLPFVGEVSGQTQSPFGIQPFTNFAGFGSREKAITEYFVPMSQAMSAEVYQVQPSGKYTMASKTAATQKALVYRDITTPSRTIKFRNRSKAEIDGYYRELLIEQAKSALTNKEISKDLPLHIFAYTSRSHPNYVPVYLAVQKDFYLVKLPDGSYTIPDFSKEEMDLGPQMGYDIPGLKWIRIEGKSGAEKVGLKAQSTGGFVLDSRYDESDILNMDIEAIILPTELVIAGSISKISTVVGANNTFRVYGSQGTQIPETPVTLCDMTPISFQIKGEVGRVVVVETAEAVDGPWIQNGYQITLPSYPVTYTPESPAGFFRTRIINMVPQ